MGSASKLPADYVAVLVRVAVRVSRQLSAATVLGLACIPLLQWTPAFLAPRGAAAPVTIVRTVPVPYLDHAAPEPSAALPRRSGKAASAATLKVAASGSRQRRSGPGTESGAPEKAGDGTATSAAASDAGSKAKANDANDDTEEEPPQPDEWSDARIIAALRDCLRQLAPLDVEIAVAQPVKKDRCGAAAPIVLKRLGTGEEGVVLRPAPTLNCAMAARLSSWVEDTLQPAARELLGSPVVSIRNVSGYACRNRVGSVSGIDRLSEHALANAIDIAAFETADGRTVEVLSGWGPTRRDLREAQEEAWNAAQEAKAAARTAEREAAKAAQAARRAKRGAERRQAEAEAAEKKEAAERQHEEARRKEAEWRKILRRTARMSKLQRSTDVEVVPAVSESAEDEDLNPAAAVFLRRLHKGACGTFGTVLGPEANAAHRDHFHFDLTPRKRRAFCR